MRKREEGREEREPEERRPLARVDASTRAGVLEQLQQSSGNRAVQEVVAGAWLQRDTATATKPDKPSTRQTAAGGWVLSLGGKVVGGVRSVGGLTVRAEVVSVAGSDVHVAKHVGRTEVEPGVLEVGLGMDKGFYDWLDDALSSKHLRQNLTLHQVDAGGRELARLEVRDAVVTGVEVPQLGAGAASPSWLRVGFAAEEVQRSAGTGAKIDAKPASNPLDPATVGLEVLGLGQVKSLRSVAPWSFKVKTTRSKTGKDRLGEATVTNGELGDLVVTLAEGANAGFDAWAEKALVAGAGSEETERSAILTVAGKDGRKLELSFVVGLFSADQLARSGAGGRRYGLYVESAVLKVL